MNKLVFFLLSFLIFTGAHAFVDPAIDWKIRRSAHFDLIYDARQQDLGLLYLDRLEKARAKLARLWTVLPDRLTVVVNDRTDLTNGYATALPYAHVVIFPVLPGPQESISEYGDWVEEILIHELTHVLSFEQRRGGARFLTYFFGRIITPNMLLPRWWLEGVAVDAETRLSSKGRLRSNYQDATLRALVSNHKWEQVSLAEINEFQIPTWPYGGRPYLYGSLLWSEMIALKGERMINDLHVSFGGRVPYMLSAPIEERFEDQNLTDLFHRAKESTKSAVLKQKQELSTVPLTELEPFKDPEFLETTTPRISPDGLKMAFFGRDDTLKRSIQILLRPSKDESFAVGHRVKLFGQKEEITAPGGVDILIPRDAPPGGTIQRISWSADSRSFIFDLVGERNLFHDASDLWTFSLITGKAKQLTRNLRAREPELSPRSDRVAFVKIEPGRTSLAVLDLKTGQDKVFYRPDLSARVSWPLWLDDNRVLVTHREMGREFFVVADLTNGNIEKPRLPFREVTLPFLRKNRLYFISNESGVRNLYQCDLNFQNPRPVTHLWTGAYASDLDEARDELWITQIGASGLEMAKRKTPTDFAGPLPRTSPLFSDRYPPFNEAPGPAAEATEEDDYNALPYLWPRYWLPFVYWDDKGTQISATTGGFDPLAKHSYSLFGSYDSALDRGSYALRYQNQSFTPSLIAQTSDLSSYLANPDQPTRVQLSALQIAWQLPGLSPDLFLGFGWSWLEREQSGFASEQTGPTMFLNYLRVQQGGEQISPESGGSAALSVTRFLEGGEREHYNLANLSLVKYGRWPWGRHHAWMFRIAGQSIDRNVSIANYDSTLSTLSTFSPFAHGYLMRGYATGAFLGKSLANVNLEYRFPLMRFDRGSDRFAFFLRRFSGALVTDGIWLDGFAYDTTREPFLYRRVTSWKGFASGGAELKMDFTLGYHLEMQLVAGVYAPISSEYARSEPMVGIGLAL